MSLFTSHTCYICGKELNLKNDSADVLDGFLDQDTGEIAHDKCKKEHYRRKYHKGMGGLYSEMPITINYQK